MSERSGEELLAKLNDENRDENKRFGDMDVALQWLVNELNHMKKQDKHLMKIFKEVREQLNIINRRGPLTDRGRSYSEIEWLTDEETARRVNQDPFDGEPDDGVSLRRRAFTVGALSRMNVLHNDIDEKSIPGA